MFSPGWLQRLTRVQQYKVGGRFVKLGEFFCKWLVICLIFDQAYHKSAFNNEELDNYYPLIFFNMSEGAALCLCRSGESPRQSAERGSAHARQFEVAGKYVRVVQDMSESSKVVVRWWGVVGCGRGVQGRGGTASRSSSASLFWWMAISIHKISLERISRWRKTEGGWSMDAMGRREMKVSCSKRGTLVEPKWGFQVLDKECGKEVKQVLKGEEQD